MADTLDVCDFPQIAAAMGVEAASRKPTAGARPPLRPTHAPDEDEAPALRAASEASPYAFSAVGPAGHMRKLEEMEADMIRMAIARYDGHMSEVARRLGIGRSTLYRKLKEFGLEQGAAESAEQNEAPAPGIRQLAPARLRAFPTRLGIDPAPLPVPDNRRSRVS